MALHTHKRFKTGSVGNSVLLMNIRYEIHIRAFVWKKHQTVPDQSKKHG